MTRLRWLLTAGAMLATATVAVTVSPGASFAAANSGIVTMSDAASNFTYCEKAIDSTTVISAPCNEEDAAQQWQMIFIGTGGPSDPRPFWQMKNLSNNRCLAPTTGGQPNAIVQLIPCTSNWVDYWSPKDVGTFNFHMINRPQVTNLQQCLVSGNANGPGNQPKLWNCDTAGSGTNFPDQMWEFKKYHDTDVFKFGEGS